MVEEQGEVAAKARLGVPYRQFLHYHHHHQSVSSATPGDQGHAGGVNGKGEHRAWGVCVCRTPGGNESCGLMVGWMVDWLDEWVGGWMGRVWVVSGGPVGC